MTHVSALSFLIVFREGLEALLILGALATYVNRAGEGHRLKALAYGAIAAIVSSVVVAWLIGQTLADMSGLAEAAVLLVASAMMFHVSIWMWRFRNLGTWQSHLETRVSGALMANSSFMLGSIAFLTVFRECAETIIFLTTLASDQDNALPPILAGISLALVALLACYWTMSRLAMRLPVRKLLVTTSVILFTLGLYFVGEAIHDLQIVGLVPRDTVYLPGPLSGLTVKLTAQALVVQLLLVTGAAILLMLTPEKAKA